MDAREKTALTRSNTGTGRVNCVEHTQSRDGSQPLHSLERDHRQNRNVPIRAHFPNDMGSRFTILMEENMEGVNHVEHQMDDFVETTVQRDTANHTEVPGDMEIELTSELERPPVDPDENCMGPVPQQAYANSSSNRPQAHIPCQGKPRPKDPPGPP